MATDRLEEIKNTVDAWQVSIADHTQVLWLIQEVERLRAIPEAIAVRCEQYAGTNTDSLAGGAFREAARIAREFGGLLLNRFDYIKSKYPYVDDRTEIGWLIAEVDRLRNLIAAQESRELPKENRNE